MPNKDIEDHITAVHTTAAGRYLVLGTLKGKVYLIEKNNGLVSKVYYPHSKKISSISIREEEDVSITTSSFDGTLYVFYPFKKVTENEKNFKRIDLKEHEISCFVKVN